MRKRVMSIGFALAVLAFVSAYGSSSNSAASSGPGGGAPSGKVTVLWSTGVTAGLDADITNFEKAYPNIHVAVESVPITAFSQTLLPRIRAGNPPDLFNVEEANSGGFGVWPFAQQNDLADLSGSPWAKGLAADIKPYVSLKGRVYGAPLGFNVVGIFANSEVFKSLSLKTPSSVADLLTTCKKLAAAGKIPIAWNGPLIAPATALAGFAGTLVLGSDPNWAAQRTAHRVTFANSPLWRSVFQLWQEMKAANCFSPGALGTSAADANRQFATGQAAMMFGAGENYPALIAINPRLHAEMINYPYEVRSQRGMAYDGVDLAMARNAPNPNATKLFLNYMEQPHPNAVYNALSDSISTADFANRVFPPQFKAALVDSAYRTFPNAAATVLTGAVNGAAINGEVGLLDGTAKSIESILRQMDRAWGDQAAGPS